MERELKEFKKKLLHDKILSKELEKSESDDSLLKSSMQTDSSLEQEH